ncbi:MAG: ferrous iron transport protein B [Fimbriimonas sp.]
MKSKSCHSPDGSVAVATKMPLVALVGNPNAGKTTLFNSLTGSFQKVGNYAGVTVEKVSAILQLPSGPIECIDVPGLYSLKAVSEDEHVALQVVQGTFPGVAKPDLLVCVIDATNLERNLYLYSQLAELGVPIIVALTMSDRLQKSGKDIDLAALRDLLGADVVPMIGHKDKGVSELKAAIERALEESIAPDPGDPSADLLSEGVAALKERLARIGMDVSRAELRRALLEQNSEFLLPFEGWPEIQEAFAEARTKLQGYEQPPEVTSRYLWSSGVEQAVVSQPRKNRTHLTDSIDRVLTHKVFGLAIFVATMMIVFLSIYSFADPLMKGIEAGFGWLANVVSPTLASVPWLQSLVVDGLIGGVGGMLVFLPQILILFFFISMLEGSGYLARAAFLMDRLLGWCGLNGRAFIPLLSSFACAIPGIMAARVMPDRNSRLATILVAPLMSCSARLPVYVLLIGAFIEPNYGPIWAGFTLFAMHFLGLVVAIPIVWTLNRKMLKGKRLPFLLELPPYQWPKWRDVWIAMYFRGKVFVQTAGTIIVLMSIVIWALSYFPRLGPAQEAGVKQQYVAQHPTADENAIDKRLAEEQLANSFLGRFGKTIEPVFVPAGFDWRITTSILSAFPARETVVPSLAIIFSLGEGVEETSGELRKALGDATWPDGRPLFTLWTSIGLMVFFALCAQCMATLAAVKRETNSWKWPLFMFVYMTTLAYIGAVLVNYLGRFLG